MGIIFVLLFISAISEDCTKEEEIVLYTGFVFGWLFSWVSVCSSRSVSLRGLLVVSSIKSVVVFSLGVIVVSILVSFSVRTLLVIMLVSFSVGECLLLLLLFQLDYL